MIYVFGHQTPDTDTVISSIAVSFLLTSMGEKAMPATLGELNDETKYVLEKWKLNTPELKKDFKGEKIFLVDHSDKSQSCVDIDKCDLVGIIDHHKLGDVTSKSPLVIQARPYGSCATVICELFATYKVKMPKPLAGALLGALLSDTVMFKSPTTVQMDIDTASELAKISEIDDIKEYANELFKVKSNFANKTAQELLKADYKEFDMNGIKIGIGQLEMSDLSLIEDKIEALKNELKEQKTKNNNHTIMLMLTDVINEGSKVLVFSDDEGALQDAFEAKIQDNEFYLKGALSRKKQIVPPLEKVFE